MNKIILPIEKNPWIQTYQIRNYELGILQNKQPWIYSKYINCYYNSQAEDCFNHCMESGRYFERDHVLMVQKIRFNKSIYSLNIIDFIEWTKSLLDNKWYIMGFFDEYYIKVKASYQNYHFRHTMLIYGYDDNEKIFYAIGYTKERKYREFTLSYDEYISSIISDFDRNIESYRKKDIDKIEFDALKINPKCEFKLDLKELYTGIRDYFYSVDTRNRNQKGLIYGIECEKCFQGYMFEALNNDYSHLDERYSRLFMEMKEIMVRRLEYLSSESIITVDKLEKYRAVSDMQKNIHFLFIKYNQTHNKSIIDRMAEKMKNIITLESELLPKISNDIEQYLIKQQKEEYC